MIQSDEDVLSGDYDDAPHPKTDSTSHAAAIITIGAIFAICAVVGTWWYTSHQNKLRVQGEAQITSALAAASDTAQQLMLSYDFNSAIQALNSTGAQITSSQYFRYEHQKQLEHLLDDCQQQKHAFEAKLASGYVVFEGKLVPKSEKAAILAERLRIQRDEEQRQLQAKLEAQQWSQQQKMQVPSNPVETHNSPESANKETLWDVVSNWICIATFIISLAIYALAGQNIIFAFGAAFFNLMVAVAICAFIKFYPWVAFEILGLAVLFAAVLIMLRSRF